MTQVKASNDLRIEIFNLDTRELIFTYYNQILLTDEIFVFEDSLMILPYEENIFEIWEVREELRRKKIVRIHVDSEQNENQQDQVEKPAPVKPNLKKIVICQDLIHCLLEHKG